MAGIEHRMHISRKSKLALNAGDQPNLACDPTVMAAALSKPRNSNPVRRHLAAWREARKKTQEWLAEQIGKTHSTVQRYETGKVGVDDKTFAKIAASYGITVAELSMHPDDAEKARALDRLLNAAQELDAEALAAVAIFAERMKRPPA